LATTGGGSMEITDGSVVARAQRHDIEIEIG
jgi:hypothetical protein